MPILRHYSRRIIDTHLIRTILGGDHVKERILWLWDHLEEAGAALLLAIMVSVAFINVLTRYLISFSMAFTEELTVYLFVWGTLLGASLAFRQGSNMMVAVLYNRFPKAGRKVLYLISAGLSLFFFVILGYYGYIQVRDEMELGVMTESMHLPLWYFSASIPIGAALILIRIFFKTISDIKAKKY